MTWLEGALFTIALLYLIVTIFLKVKNSLFTRLLSLTGFGLLIGHVLFDTPSWQLYPIYFFIAMTATVTLVGISIKSQGRSPKNNWKALTIAGDIAVLVSAVSILVFPVYEISVPDGASDIGTLTFEITDPNRVEVYGDMAETAEKFRRLRVQMWYPSDSVSDYQRVPWLQDGVDLPRSLAKEMNLPFFVLDHTKDILSNAYLEAPISEKEDTYPVIILSHGWKGFRNLHNDFAELLASHGFIVLGIDHSYGAQMTVFEDGSLIEVDLDALPERGTSPDFITYAHQLVQTYADDIELILDTLEAINSGSISTVINGELDLNQIGLIGHSTGGGAGVSLALNDNRVKALVGMDAWVEPLGMEEMISGLSIPAFFIRSEQWKGGINDDYLMTLVDTSQETELFQIDGTTHIDFTMSYMFSSLTGMIGFTGDLDRELSARIQHDLVLKFFTQEFDY